MTTNATTAQVIQTSDRTRPSTHAGATRQLLTIGAIGGPAYIAAGLVQALLRDGFDLGHHPLSLLSTGRYGWIQILNFIVAGLITIAMAVGFHRAMDNQPGSRWTPRLLAAYGVGLVAAGVFVTDPMNKFPGGTPDGPPDKITWHGAAHLTFAGLGFAGLVAAMFVTARYFTRRNETRWARYTRATAVTFLVGFMSLSSGEANAARLAVFWVGMLAATIWLTATALRLRTNTNQP